MGIFVNVMYNTRNNSNKFATSISKWKKLEWSEL